MIYAFGRYKLNTQTYELHCDGDLCPISARAFQVLSYLIENRDHTVSRDELLENLWPDQIVSEGIISNCIMMARRAIGDRGSGHGTIRTLYNAGYLFVAEVEELNPAALNEEADFAQTPLFIDEETDIKTEGDVFTADSSIASSSPQNVLEEDYLLVTVACGVLNPIEAQVENVGHELIQNLSGSFFKRAQQVIMDYEGDFRLFGLDGFLAVFGWPLLHEDHAQRAVRAGLDLQEALRNQDLTLETEASIEAAVGIGLHSGPMELRNRRNRLAAVMLTDSETTTAAIRLQHFAKSGLMLASPTTLALLQDHVEYVEHRTVFLPGHPVLTPAYRIDRLAV